MTSVCFEYDEDTRKWDVVVKGVKDKKEACQAFYAVVLTLKQDNPIVGQLYKIEQITETNVVTGLANFRLTPAV